MEHMEPAKLNLQCLDILLSQLSVDDHDAFTRVIERKAATRIWLYSEDEMDETVGHFNEHIIFANTEEEALQILSKSKFYRDSSLFNNKIKTYYLHGECGDPCYVCGFKSNDEKEMKLHSHLLNEFNDEHWLYKCKIELNILYYLISLGGRQII